MSQPVQNAAYDQAGIAAATSIVLLGPNAVVGNQRIYGLVASTQAFRIDVEISSDNGATFTIAKSINSSAGNDATYTQAAEIDQALPSYFRVSARNTSANAANFRGDVRLYVTTGH